VQHEKDDIETSVELMKNEIQEEFREAV